MKNEGGLSPGGAPEVARSKYVCALKGELTRLVDKLSMGKTKRGVKENPSFWPESPVGWSPSYRDG